jgi:2,4-dienoyl-CoA reductase-like NADH-dependent reductase (Old Yellow Enzyme family)
MTKLFTPLTLRGLELRNRVIMAPMCMYSCENRDGIVGDWHFTHYGSRAVGGVGLVIVEATGIVPEGRITPWCTGIWSEEHAAAWKIVTDEIRRHGAASAIQLAHAGRKASTHRSWSGTNSVDLNDGGWQTVSSTSEPFTGYAEPKVLSTAEVYEVIQQWMHAAELSVKAGFDAIEIHAAHGYLIHQFLSPITNKRSDEFGGSLENRARFLLEVIKAVLSVIPNQMPLLVRFSATDYREDGWDVEQTKQVAAWAAELGVDLFDISSGGLITGVSIPSGPGYQVPLAAAVSSAVEEPVATVGQITEAAQSEAILQSGDADVISLGRALLRDPYWALRAAAELGAEVEWPKQYSRGSWPAKD